MNSVPSQTITNHKKHVAYQYYDEVAESNHWNN